MEIEKIRNLSDGELDQQVRQSSEQIFRIRFQTKLGQNDGVNKLRQLKKDVARIKTIARERELSLHGETHKIESARPAKAVKAAKKPKKEAK
jgi:large subunit ribosomal protein L29